MGSEGADVELVACHECDHLYRREPIPAGARADCRHCGAMLYRHVPGSLDRTLALHLAAAVLFVIANSFPFLSLKVGGIEASNHLIGGAIALWQHGMPELGLLVFGTSIAFPGIAIAGMLWLLLPVRLGVRPPALGPVWRLVHALNPWSLVGVFLLGTLISVVKLQSLAAVIPGIALYAFVALLLVLSAARAGFDPHVLWGVSRFPQLTEADLDAGMAVHGCHACGLLRPAHLGEHHCPRCHGALHHRTGNSIQRTWALLVAAAILFIPANIYPVMTVMQLGRGEPSTIIGGVVTLMGAGMYGLAFIVLFASIVVPLAKLIALAVLLWTAQHGSAWRPRDRTLLYRVTEVVGAWSMVDVFLVGLLSGLVSLGALAEITPGIGVTFFAGVVVLTMIAAHSFDPRLLWDPVRGTAVAAPRPDPAVGRAAA